MAGFLSRLEKKGHKKATGVEELLVPTPSSTNLRVPPELRSMRNSPPKPPSTKIVEANESVGSPDSLLAELQAESGKKSVPRVAKSNASNIDTRTQENFRTRSRVRIVQSSAASAIKKTDMLSDESLPWWLTEPTASSPQVDALVPAARVALNDLITDNVTTPELSEAIQKAVNIAAEKLSAEIRFSTKDIHDAVHELTSLMLGKGPIQALYDDPSVTDIYLDRHDSIKCVRRGQALETPFRFRNSSEYEGYISSMLQSADRVLNLSSPIVDCVLSDQWRSRVNAIHSSLLDNEESSMVIRVPRLQQISFYDLLRTKTLPAAAAAWLAELVSCGEANILVIGPTGSGKTTLTTALLSAVGSDERICTIEDVPEIFVPTAHIEKLVSRPENAQGEGAVGMDRLLRAALRRAPHRIVVGEIRDKEGPLFLRALETGHMGSVATIHAENPRDGLWRLLDVVAAYEKAPQESIQRRIARSVHVLISMKKINGRPCLTEIAEVHKPVGGEFVVKQILKYEGENEGKREWRLMSNRSIWGEKIAKRGVELRVGPGILPTEMPREDRDRTEV